MKRNLKKEIVKFMLGMSALAALIYFLTIISGCAGRSPDLIRVQENIIMAGECAVEVSDCVTSECGERISKCIENQITCIGLGVCLISKCADTVEICLNDLHRIIEKGEQK